MWKIILLSCVLATNFNVLVLGASGDLIAEGTWIVDNVNKCPDPEKYPIDYEIKRRKLNRTTDAFYAKLDLPDIIQDHTYAVHMVINKKCDGGWKFQQYMDDKCLCHLMREYAEENMHQLLAQSGVDPPDCPIPKGLLEIEEWVMNYDELPKKGMMGEFEVFAYLLQGQTEVFCILLYVSFNPYSE